MSRIAVTGGAGFIGSHLVDELVAKGHEVMVIDNLCTGRRRQVHSGAEFVQMDILDDGLAAVLRKFRTEAVYHHAAQVSVPHSIQDPLLDARTNVLGSVSVLNACRHSEVRKCIYASSAAVYGMPGSSRIQEGDAIRPHSFYGISKHTPELYLETCRQLFGLDYTVLRYSNVYGGRQDDRGEGGVVSIFADRLLSGERPVIFGTGEQTRDFIYVKDVVAANLAALNKGSGLVMNVSSDRSVSVNDLLKEMCQMTGQPFAPRFEPAREGDIRDSRLSNRLAVHELNWNPVYSLRDGLLETLRFYRNEKGGRQGAG